MKETMKDLLAKEELIDKVIAKFGFEHPYTINFAAAACNFPLETMKFIYNDLMKMSVYLDD